MRLVLYVSLLIYLYGVLGETDVKSKMEEHGVKPDVIDVPPSEKLIVEYENNKTVELGNELKPFDVKYEPKIQLTTDPDSYYTLLMIDPDAPSRANPMFGEILHWLVGNIKGTDLKSGEYICEYAGSGPPKGTQLHRYIFLLFNQEQGKIQFDEPKTKSNSRAHRVKFNTRKFMDKYKFGVPVSGNLFLAQWDDYVEIRKTIIED